MLPDRVSNPGPLTYESGVLPIALRGPAIYIYIYISGTALLNRCEQFKVCLDTPPTQLCRSRDFNGSK